MHTVLRKVPTLATLSRAIINRNAAKYLQNSVRSQFLSQACGELNKDKVPISIVCESFGRLGRQVVRRSLC